MLEQVTVSIIRQKSQKMKHLEKKNDYMAPVVKVVSFTVDAGFQASTDPAETERVVSDSDDDLSEYF